MRRFINILRKSDLVIAGNSILAEEAEKYTTHCQVLPSAVETRNIAVKDYEQANDRFVIGWVGGNINLPCLKALSQVLQNLARRHAIEVRVISGQSMEIPGVECRFIPWHEDTQEKEIAQFDVGVMPLFDYPHTQGKCAYKALQYMAAGVPPVVSDVGINKQVVKHGVSGYVARNLPDFEKYIEKLIMDRKLQRDMGSAARSRAAAHFSIERVGQDLARLLH
jgi:glycosyltransferase involved in cell wall biosynthesis